MNQGSNNNPLTLAWVYFYLFKILDRYYPEVGGTIDDLKNKPMSELDYYQIFRIKLRVGIRNSINIVLCTIIARPFLGIFFFLIKFMTIFSYCYPSNSSNYWK